MSVAPVQTGEEPPMFLQRPSSARSQDVSHVLAKTFRQHFTRDSVAPDTVENLHKSRGGDDVYHERYVAALKAVKEERDRRMAEAAMLERHIMQSQARAMSADERQLNRMIESNSSFPDLGLPPVRSNFRSTLDTALLKKHNLITPEDFANDLIPMVPAPMSPPLPEYARETMSSRQRHYEDEDGLETPPLTGRLSEDGSERLRPSESSGMDMSLPQLPDSAVMGRALWKEEAGTEERDMNRQDLVNLHAKVDFLRNPRHMPASAARRSLLKSAKSRPKEVGIKPKTHRESPKEPSIVFIASPEVVQFSEYSVGKVYEVTLELKNVTTVLRPVRVLPPKSQYFSVGLGQFPGEHGLVAPGMSCLYVVRFAPDSLCDFDDILTVQTQSSTPLEIRLQGRRPPPNITLPATIDVGQCLVGGVKVAQFCVRNEGGPGRFCLLPAVQWPASNYKMVAQSGTVGLQHFEVRPPVLELSAGEAALMEVLFAPDAVQRYTHSLTLVCDNCHVKHFSVTGEGQVARVELVTVEGGVAEAVAGELCDLTAQHLVKFDSLNPYTYMQKKVSIKNPTDLDLPFDWVLVKPYIKCRDPDSTEQPAIPRERVQDMSAVFSIEPECGVLRPNCTAEFLVTFAPPEVNLYHSVLHLVLRNIPKLLPALPPTTPLDPDAVVDPPTNKAPPSAGADEMTLEDVTALEVEVKGECESLSVLLQPYALHQPGAIRIQTSLKRQFRMINSSLSPILFQWETFSGQYILEVEPPVGELGAGCEYDFDLSISGAEPCIIDHTLTCHVQHLEAPLTLNVQAQIKGPEVAVEQSSVDYGLVQLGGSATCIVSVRNTCRVPAKWCIRESATHQQDTGPQAASEFEFRPSSGELRPLEVRDIEVTFTPTSCKSLRTVFEVVVEEGDQSGGFLQEVEEILGSTSNLLAYSSALLVSGEVQTPEVCLLQCEHALSDVYLDVPVCQQVTLLNQTLLPTTFEWGTPEGSSADLCSVEIEPQSGRIEPRQHLKVDVHFTAHKTGEISEVVMPCHIGGMDKPIFLSLSAVVQGLSVCYSTPTDTGADSEDLLLDFGHQVALGETPKQRMVIRNNSAIAAPYTIGVEHFYAKPPTPPEHRPKDFPPSKGTRRGMLARTPNLADPMSKTAARAHSDLCKSMLAEGRGASFLVLPASGVLPPFGEVQFEVTAYSDMWGHYTDRLVCRVERLDLVYVPLQMTVIGCPLHFQMVAAAAHHQPILRFGTHVSGIGPIVRQMRVNNPCPYDVRVDWQVFNQDETDRQLMDFIVAYGHAFPLLDAQGCEVAPSGEVAPDSPVPPTVQKYPSFYLPNTPDSTPVTSRQMTTTSDLSQPSSGCSRPKVITVTTRLHGGRQGSAPYNISPAQLVIPARGNACINVSFTARAEADSDGPVDCLGHALGYMTLDEQVSHISDKVTRDEGYHMAPLRLEMTAQVKPALLTIECHDDDAMRYCCAASDLMVDGQMQPEYLRVCRAMLTNATLTPLVFRLVTSEPFQIVQLDAATQTPTAQLLQTDAYSLKSRQNALVQVGFRVSLDLLEYADVLSAPAESRPHSLPEGIELEEREHERRLHFNGNLIVEFTNQATQRLPLSATLVLPSLVLSKESVDFGTCLVGQRRELQLILSNPTTSTSYWTCVQERQSGACVAETFAVTPSSGELHANITHVSLNKCLIQIFFTAKHTEAYEAVYVFHGMLGEQPQRLYIKGQGSYDGKHEAIVSV